jgi:hypothetical protein
MVRNVHLSDFSVWLMDTVTCIKPLRTVLGITFSDTVSSNVVLGSDGKWRCMHIILHSLKTATDILKFCVHIIPSLVRVIKLLTKVSLECEF